MVAWLSWGRRPLTVAALSIVYVTSDLMPSWSFERSAVLASSSESCAAKPPQRLWFSCMSWDSALKSCASNRTSATSFHMSIMSSFASGSRCASASCAVASASRSSVM
jgi:hypothetical protein